MKVLLCLSCLLVVAQAFSALREDQLLVRHARSAEDSASSEENDPKDGAAKEKTLAPAGSLDSSDEVEGSGVRQRDFVEGSGAAAEEPSRMLRDSPLEEGSGMEQTTVRVRRDAVAETIEASGEIERNARDTETAVEGSGTEESSKMFFGMRI